MRRSRLLLVGLAVALAVGGCSRGGTTQGGAGAGDQSKKTYASRDELVAAAKAEGQLKVLTSMVPETNAALQAGFMKHYPEIKTQVDEQQNDEGQKTLLELQAGQVDYDILHLGKTDGYAEFLPFTERIDLLAMSKAGTIKMPEGLINPHEPHIMAAGSGLGAIAWNKKLVPESEVPSSWEDLLDPKYKGQFMLNIEAEHVAELMEAWGQEKVLDYARKLAAQEPIWSDSDTAGLTLMAAGEQKMYAFVNYHSAYRVQKKQPDVVGIKLLDPVPASYTQLQAIRKDTAHPAAATLFLEYLTTPEAQGFLDELEPAQSAVLAEGSMAAELTKGEKISIILWDDFAKLPEWSAMVQKEWGFPTAQVS
jgi:iron(III) transport system substrate-binding protein